MTAYYKFANSYVTRVVNYYRKAFIKLPKGLVFSHLLILFRLVKPRISKSHPVGCEA